MSKAGMIAGVLSGAVALGAGGFVAYNMMQEPPKETKQEMVDPKNAKKKANKASLSEEAVKKDMRDLSREILVNMNTEKRLNTSMMSQLRAYNSMQKQIQDYAKKVEGDIDYIRAIAKDEFQEDVKMQAELYTGKKPHKVAKQLEKFSPFRAGAILAHLKPKDAGNVLDVWAKSPDPDIEPFYKEVMIAYLKNKRFLENPGLFEGLDKGDEKKKN